MTLECTSAILAIVPQRVSWIDRSSLQLILSTRAFSDRTVEQSIRYLAKRELIERHYVNLPPAPCRQALYRSASEMPLDVRAIRHDLLCALGSVMQPAEVIGPSKLWSGIAGCEYRRPREQHQWQAWHRLASALVAHAVQPGWRLQTWKQRLSKSANPAAVYAASQVAIICVPVRFDRKSLERCIDRLQQKGASYEIW